MLKRIEFTENWNGKLCLDLFTTIRLRNPDKYVDMDLYEVVLKGQVLGVAKLLGKNDFKYKNLNDRTTWVDSGKSLSYFKSIFNRMYGGSVTPETYIYMLFFQWTERDIQAQSILFKRHWEKLVERAPHVTQQSFPFLD